VTDPEDELILKAALEFGADYTYSIKNGGHGRTLVANAYTKLIASALRARMPTYWEGLYTLVIYDSSLNEEIKNG